MMSSPVLILASASPRRRQLLTEAGYQFQVVEPRGDVECGLCSEEGPAGLVADKAYRKAADVVGRLSADLSPDGAIVLAADTVAECDGQILGKPSDERDARAMLGKLNGRKHRVLSGVCVWPIAAVTDRQPAVRVAVTDLRMDPLTDDEIDQYVSSGQWEGKAGAFGYQDRLGWVHVDEGSESNVVGLPMELVAEMLAEAGIAV